MTEIVMPRLWDSMEEGTILKWLKADGDEVARGEPLAEIETDKATLTFESDAAGVLTIVAISKGVVDALEAAETLAADGIDAEVIDLRSLRPLDVETVAASVRKTNHALLIEEGWPSFGVTAELAARIQHVCFDFLDAPVERVGMAEVPLPYAKNLENAALPNVDRILAAAHSVLAGSRR